MRFKVNRFSAPVTPYSPGHCCSSRAVTPQSSHSLWWTGRDFLTPIERSHQLLRRQSQKITLNTPNQQDSHSICLCVLCSAGISVNLAPLCEATPPVCTIPSQGTRSSAHAFFNVATRGASRFLCCGRYAQGKGGRGFHRLRHNFYASAIGGVPRRPREGR